MVALQSEDIQEALQARCEVIAPLPKLTRELQFQCKAMGTSLPFLPFSTDDERMQFSNYLNSLQSPVETIDDKKAAIDWCAFVDGQKIMPKLPCHIRVYIRQWMKNQRSKDLFQRSKSGREKLDELNSIEQADPAPNQPILLPPAIPQPQPGAMHNEPYTIVAKSLIGELPESRVGKRKRGDRGKDKEGKKCRPKQRRCLTCVQHGGTNFAVCVGRWPRGTCQYYPT